MTARSPEDDPEESPFWDPEQSNWDEWRGEELVGPGVVAIVSATIFWLVHSFGIRLLAAVVFAIAAGFVLYLVTLRLAVAWFIRAVERLARHKP